MSPRVKVTVVYPLDPLGPKIGGSVTFIRGLLQHAPPTIDLRFVGVTCDAVQRPPLRWTTQHMEGRRFEFLPVLHEAREDQRHRVPLSLRFVHALAGQRLADDGALLVHNRLETLLGRGVRKHRNIAFIHNDVPAQVGSGPSEVLWSRFPWLYYRFEQHAFKFVDQVYTVSTNTLSDCRRRHPTAQEKFAFVPTWVDTSRFAPSVEPKRAVRARLVARGLDIDIDAPWILYVGRLQPQKAPQRLLDAFALLRRQQPSAQLILIGDGNLRGAVEDQVRRQGLAASVHLLGPVPQTELPSYYHAAELLVLTSNFEGMPMCVLEALACGLPVVTTRVGEVARVVQPGTTGEIAGAADAASVCSALLHALGRTRDADTGYDPHACVAVVRPFSPPQVLAPIYARIDELARRSDVPN